jgi:hypothetical protein
MVPCSQSPTPVPILSQMNPVYSPSYFPTITFILSSHLRLGLPSDRFVSGFPTKILYTFLIFPTRYNKFCFSTFVIVFTKARYCTQSWAISVMSIADQWKPSQNKYLRSDDVTAAKLSIVVFRFVTPCGLVGGYQRGTFATTYKAVQRHNPGFTLKIEAIRPSVRLLTTL